PAAAKVLASATMMAGCWAKLWRKKCGVFFTRSWPISNARVSDAAFKASASEGSWRDWLIRERRNKGCAAACQGFSQNLGTKLCRTYDKVLHARILTAPLCSLLCLVPNNPEANLCRTYDKVLLELDPIAWIRS